MSDRFHRAARDGYLQVLKEATRRDCNQPDEDGLTPTILAAYEGNLQALRLLIGRGGDPNRCDHYGNTALHCASARGHMSCVTFLVNFGVNIWAVDNELHTAKELAAMNDREEVLRFLDTVYAKETTADPKQAKKLQDKAQKDAEKRRKEFEKIQKKADKKREEENVKLEKERAKLEGSDDKSSGRAKGLIATISRGSVPLLGAPKSRDTDRPLHENINNSPRFSDLTTTSNNSAKKTTMGGIQRRILKKKVMEEQKVVPDFKVATVESDGKKSMRNIKGLRRDSEIMLVPNGSLSSSNTGRRGRLTDVFEEGEDEGSVQGMMSKGSLFARPGFGSVAFRSTSINATLSSLTESGRSNENEDQPPLAPRGGPHPWEEEDLPSDDEDDENAGQSHVYTFLAAAGLVNFIPVFAREHIDLDALMLLTEEDLINLNLPLGPRRKLLKAIGERRMAMDDPGEVEDSRL